jgi:serine/threonine protein kinase
MYDKTTEIWKLIDFNLAIDLETDLMRCFEAGVGTRGFMAPEVIFPQEDIGYGCKADIFSFGKTVEYDVNMLLRQSHAFCKQDVQLFDFVISLCLRDETSRPSALELKQKFKT